MKKLVSQAAYARLRGVSAAAVSKAVQTGRISLIDGLIDPSVADVQWRENTNAAKSRQSSMRAPDDSIRIDPNDPSFELIQSSRARQDAARARLLELELDQAEGRLVDAEAMKRAVFAVVRGIRDRTFQIAARIAPILAAEMDPVKVDKLIEAEIRAVFETAAREMREKGVMGDAQVAELQRPVKHTLPLPGADRADG